MIITNDGDRRVAAWLLTVATTEQIANAVAVLGDRAWPGKVAAKLKLQIPAMVYDPATAAQGIEKLKALRASFKAREAS